MKLDKTIESLDGMKTEKPSFHSGLANRCFELQKTPLIDLSPEDLRLLISQKIGLLHTVPLALELLENDILASGDMYTGDLLFSVSSIDEDFWKSNPHLNNRLVEIAQEAEEIRNTLDKVLPNLLERMYL